MDAMGEARGRGLRGVARSGDRKAMERLAPWLWCWMQRLLA